MHTKCRWGTSIFLVMARLWLKHAGLCWLSVCLMMLCPGDGCCMMNASVSGDVHTWGARCCFLSLFFFNNATMTTRQERPGKDTLLCILVEVTVKLWRAHQISVSLWGNLFLWGLLWYVLSSGGIAADVSVEGFEGFISLFFQIFSPIQPSPKTILKHSYSITSAAVTYNKYFSLHFLLLLDENSLLLSHLFFFTHYCVFVCLYHLFYMSNGKSVLSKNPHTIFKILTASFIHHNYAEPENCCWWWGKSKHHKPQHPPPPPM